MLLVLTKNITDIPGKVVKSRGNIIRVEPFRELHLFLVQIIFHSGQLIQQRYTHAG